MLLKYIILKRPWNSHSILISIELKLCSGLPLASQKCECLSATPKSLLSGNLVDLSSREGWLTHMFPDRNCIKGPMGKDSISRPFFPCGPWSSKLWCSPAKHSAGLTHFIKMATQKAVSLLLFLCINYLKIPVRPVLPMLGLPAFDLSCVMCGVTQLGVRDPCKPSTPSERWKSRGQTEAAGNHFKDEVARLPRLTP